MTSRAPQSHRTPARNQSGRNAPPQCMFFIAPITALLQPANRPPTPASKSSSQRRRTRPIKLARILAESGYDRVGQVEVRGEFALRGGILDIFPYTSESPFRIDFFGETIESIKPFDPLSNARKKKSTPSNSPTPRPARSNASSPRAPAPPLHALDHCPTAHTSSRRTRPPPPARRTL